MIRHSAALCLFVLLSFVVRPGFGLCGGDCDGSNTVTVDEVVLGVNMALGTTSLVACRAFDANDDGQVTVDEILQAVNNALAGCPRFGGRYQSAVALDSGRSGRLDLTIANAGASGTLVISDAARGATGIVALDGTVDLLSGSFSVSGSLQFGGTTIPVNVSGTLPATAGANGIVSFHIGDSIYGSTIAAVADTTTPTPTPTPPAGTAHTIKVGQPEMPFDPELLDIAPGDSVTWTWLGGPHSVVAGPGTLPPPCTASGLFDSGIKSAGSFTYTFSTPGLYTYHCGVPGHCESFESGYIQVLGPATPTRTATATVPPTLTATPTPELVAGLSRAMLGTFAGVGHTSFGTDIDLRFRIRSENDNSEIRLTDLAGLLFGANAELKMNVVNPTTIEHHVDDPLGAWALTLELDGPDHLTGLYTHELMPMGSSNITMTLTREALGTARRAR